jgi:hypothetical protein
VGICSGSTIVGVGDSEPPQFIYDEDKCSDVFVSGYFSAFCDVLVQINVLRIPYSLKVYIFQWGQM